MNQFVPSIDKLIDCFCRLPGIGRKGATRLAFSVISMDEKAARDFADAILACKRDVRFCKICQDLTESEICSVCADSRRERGVICVVEKPRDVAAIENMHEYKGLYHVLHGVISPIDDVGPDQLKLKELLSRAAEENVSEVILALNPTIEGDATALYIARLLKPLGVLVTRLASGLPLGGDLEYADKSTIYRAFEGRREVD